MKRNINKQKRLHRNIYHFPLTKDQWFQYALFVLGMSTLMDALKNVIGDKLLAIWIVLALVLVVMVAKSVLEHASVIKPYGPEEQFIGLYSIEGNQKIELNEDNGLIARNEEIDCLKGLIDECFADKRSKRGICLIGRSGSGKSTIINQFEYSEDVPYTIWNFSDSYDYLEEYILSLYKNNPEKNLVDTDKTVFILDHFERYFSLDDKKKAAVKRIIYRFAKLPAVFVFSMREEFFVPFVKELDINNLAEREPGAEGSKGILFFKKYLAGNRAKQENNVLICGSEKGKSDDKSVTQTMKRLCQQAFGLERGNEVYGHFQNSTLIQQQIIFNLMKHDYDVEGEIPVLDSNVDENMMMKRYYDVQLCSTGDYFMASRIMYLLSVGRNSGIFFTDDDIKNALCIFDKKDVEDFKKCFDRLHELKLIKYSARNTTVRYEIAHDYIAKSFEAYANTELPANVKSSLDEFKSEYTRNTNMNNMISNYRKKRKWIGTGTFGWLVFILSIAITLFSFVYDFKSGSSRLPWTVFVLCVASILYVFSFYMNITRHYRKGAWILVTLFYFIAICMGTIASVFPEYWLHCLGIGNSAMGFSCIIIGLNFHLAEAARKWFQSYGLKTFAMGGLFVVLAFMVQFGRFGTVWIIDTKSVLQFLPMAALLIYAYLAHLNKEFFYTGVEGIFSTGR